MDDFLTEKLRWQNRFSVWSFDWVGNYLKQKNFQMNLLQILVNTTHHRCFESGGVKISNSIQFRCESIVSCSCEYPMTKTGETEETKWKKKKKIGYITFGFEFHCMWSTGDVHFHWKTFFVTSTMNLNNIEQQFKWSKRYG